MEELIAAAISAGVAIIGAIATFIVTRLRFKPINGYYVICPKCGTKVYISAESLKKDNEE